MNDRNPHVAFGNRLGHLVTIGTITREQARRIVFDYSEACYLDSPPGAYAETMQALDGYTTLHEQETAELQRLATATSIQCPECGRPRCDLSEQEHAQERRERDRQQHAHERFDFLG